MKRYFVMSHDTARQNAIKAVAEAPEGYIVEVKEPTRNLEQNALIHAVLTDYGNLIGWKFSGQVVSLEDLKSIMMAAFRKVQGQESRFVIGFDGQPVILNWRTRELSKREAAEFIDMVQAYMAEQEA